MAADLFENDKHHFGLVLFFDEESDEYITFTIKQKGVLLIHRQGEEIEVLAKDPELVLGVGVWHQFLVYCKEKSLKFLLNNEVVFGSEIIVNKPPGSRLGFYTQGG